jgi:cell division protein FtsB
MAATDDEIIAAVQVYRLAKESVDSLVAQKQVLVDQRTALNTQIQALNDQIVIARQSLSDNRINVKTLIVAP